MQSWTDSVITTVGQCVTIEVGMFCSGNSVVVVSSNNPDCVVTHTISDFEISSEIQNNDAVQSIEVVKVVGPNESCKTKISFAPSKEGLVILTCSVLSGDADIVRANLTLD